MPDERGGRNLAPIPIGKQKSKRIEARNHVSINAAKSSGLELDAALPSISTASLKRNLIRKEPLSRQEIDEDLSRIFKRKAVISRGGLGSEMSRQSSLATLKPNPPLKSIIPKIQSGGKKQHSPSSGSQARSQSTGPIRLSKSKIILSRRDILAAAAEKRRDLAIHSLDDLAH